MSDIKQPRRHKSALARQVAALVQRPPNSGQRGLNPSSKSIATKAVDKPPAPESSTAAAGGTKAVEETPLPPGWHRMTNPNRPGEVPAGEYLAVANLPHPR